MKKLFIMCLLATVLLLSGCGSADVPDGQTTSPEKGTTAEGTKPEQPTSEPGIPTVNVPKNAAAYSGVNYADVMAELTAAGFVNIEEVPVEDLTSDSTILDGAVIDVIIDGVPDYSAGQAFREEARVVVQYHHLRKILIPVSTEEAGNMSYSELAQRLVEAGFTNVQTDEIYDLDSLTFHGEYETVADIGGNIGIQNETPVAFDTKILVTGHYPFARYKVKIAIDFYENWLFSKYGVNVTFDKELPVALEHGQSEAFEYFLPAGNYKLRVQSQEDADILSEITVAVSSDMEATYEIRCHSASIDLTEQAMKAPDKLRDDQVEAAYSSAYFLRKDAETSVQALKSMGFTNVTMNPVKDTLWGTTAAGTVTSVSIAGQKDFSGGVRFAKDAKVVVSYHVPDASFAQSEMKVVVGERFDLPFTVAQGDRMEDVTVKIRNKALIEALGEDSYKAKAAGETVIGAYYQEVCLAECVVTIDAKVVPIESITLIDEEVTVSVGARFRLKYLFAPLNANYTQTTVTLSNPIMEQLDSNTFYVMQEGDTELTISQDDRVLGTMKVHAVYVPVEQIAFQDTCELLAGRQAVLPFTIQPENSTAFGLSVSVANPEVATVSFDEQGDYLLKLTGVTPGKTTIILTTAEGVSYEKKIEVTEIVPETVSISSNTKRLLPGDAGKLTVVIAPADVTDKTVKWESSAPDIVKVNPDGAYQGIKPGKAMITAKHKSGVQGTIELEVLPVPVEGITITSDWNQSNPFRKNDTMKLTVVTTPENATDKAVTWKSTDKSVATVSDKGVVKAVGSGTVTIIATSANGVSAQYPLEVKPSPQRFRITYSLKLLEKNHVGDDWSSGFEFDGDAFSNGGKVTVTPGETFTLCGWAEEHDSSPDHGSYYKSFTLTEEMCRNGLSITEEFYVKENRGRYSGNTARWRVTITMTPID